MAKQEKDLRTVVVRNARLSFPHIYEPQEQENDDGSTRKSFNCVLMVPKEDNPQLKRVLADMKAGAREAKARAWGDDESKWPKIPASMTCFKDGDNDDHFTTPRDEYAGHYIISASAPVNRRPSVITNRKDSEEKWMEAEVGRKDAPYAGCYVNGIIELYGQKKDAKRKMPNRINASFSTIQYLRKGEPFANQSADANDLLGEDDVSYEGELDDDAGGYGGEEDGDGDDSMI